VVYLYEDCSRLHIALIPEELSSNCALQVKCCVFFRFWPSQRLPAQTTPSVGRSAGLVRKSLHAFTANHALFNDQLIWPTGRHILRELPGNTDMRYTETLDSKQVFLAVQDMLSLFDLDFVA